MRVNQGVWIGLVIVLAYLAGVLIVPWLDRFAPMEQKLNREELAVVALGWPFWLVALPTVWLVVTYLNVARGRR